MLIFSYGSNLCIGRLRERVPSAEPVSTAVLTGHDLRWHKRSRDGSAKADAHATGDPADRVWGVVYEIDADRKPDLDEAEGLGGGYGEKTVTVEAPDGTEYEAQIYVATAIDASLVPYRWYHRYVVRGARRHGLPEEYVRRIEDQPTREDPDAERRARPEPREERVADALAWISSRLRELEVPFQVAGGLAAVAHGASRELNDIDLYVPGGSLERLLPELRDHHSHGPRRHRDDRWDCYFMELHRAGEEIELAEASRTRYRRGPDHPWHGADVDFGRSVRRQVYGVAVPVMPRDELVAYKRRLDRPVDREDVRALTDP